MSSDADRYLGEPAAPVERRDRTTGAASQWSRGWRWLRRALLVLVHSNLWISLGAASLAVSTMVLAGLPVDPLPAVLVFGATMVVYGVNRLTDLAVDEQNVPGRAAFTRTYGVWLFGVGVALYLATVALAVAWGIPYAELLVLPPAVGVLYSLKGVQRQLLVKNALVGVGWGVVPLGVGVYFDAITHPYVLAMAGITFVLLTIAAMVFDVKDIDGDRAAGVRTVPTEFGPAWTRRIAILVTTLVGVAVAGAIGRNLLPGRFLAVVAIAAYVACYSAFATPERTPIFYGFVVDGEHLLLALLALTIT